MTPDQKEAHRREALEAAAKVADHCHLTGVMGAQVVAAAIRALAASQPAPAAECEDCGSPLNEDGECLRDLAEQAHDDEAEARFLAANTGQAVDEVEALRKALYGFTQGNGDFMEARRLLGDRAPAADTGQAVTGYMRKEDVGQRSFWVNREPNAYYSVPVYTHPAPLDAERVREDDYVTHHHDWRAACLIAKSVAVMECDVSYWQHQIDTLDRLWEANHVALRQKEGEA